MKLAICTDVFADLSCTDMLDKVKSLGIDAVEMTAGGWGARKHCNTAELLADEGKRKEFMGELEKRGMRISALNTSCNPLWPSKTGEEYKKSMYDCATLAGLLGVKKIVAMAGLPAGSETDTTPNWITSTVSWPDFMAPAYEYQWKVTIEFWNEFIAHCKKCGIEHIAIEEFPGTMVWSATARSCCSSTASSIICTLSLFCCRLSCWSCSFSISETRQSIRRHGSRRTSALSILLRGSIAGLPPHMK